VTLSKSGKHIFQNVVYIILYSNMQTKVADIIYAHNK